MSASMKPDVLVLDHGDGAEPGLGAGEVQRVFEGRAHGADAGRADQRRGPAERSGDDALAVAAGLSDEVVGGHADAVEVHPGGDHAAVAELVVDIDDADPRGAPGTAMTASDSSAPAVRVGAADHRVEVGAVAVPAGAVGRVVLLPGDHPVVAVASGQGLDPAGRVGRVEVRAAGDVGERVGGQQLTLLVLDEGPQQAFLLLRRAVLDHRLQPEAGCQQGRRHVDVDPGQFLGGDREVEHGEAAAAVFGRDERLGEPGAGHLPVSLAAGEERLPPVGRPVDRRCDRSASTPSAKPWAFFCSSCWLSLRVKSMAICPLLCTETSPPWPVWPGAVRVRPRDRRVDDRAAADETIVIRPAL